MVMVDDSCSRGHRFESQQGIKDGNFLRRLVVKIVLFFIFFL